MAPHPPPRHSLVDLANLAFLGVLLLSYGLAFALLPRRGLPLAAYLALLLLLLAAVQLRRSGAAGGWTPLLLLAYPVAFLFLAFESLALTLPHLAPRRFDAALAGIDFALLGVHPTLWLEPLARPWLTDLLALAYLLYFPLPLILLGWMVAKGRLLAAEDAIVRYLMCYYGAYLAYFLVPAEGPRAFLAEAQRGPLPSGPLAGPITRLIDALEPNKLDAFPSLHAAILVVTLLLAARENRALLAWLLPLGAAILVSLVYLRYHYLVDVAAGVAWALASYLLGGALFRRLAPSLAPHFGKDR